MIQFYSASGEYGYMSNFSSHPIRARSLIWPTSEHYFQAQKFVGTCTKSFTDILNAASPADAAKMGRERTRPLRPDWEAVKDHIMLHAVRLKFNQHDDIRKRLIATSDMDLVEHTKNDSYWGDGGDGKGGNMLGRILMQVRSELQVSDKPIIYVAFNSELGWAGQGWYFYDDGWDKLHGPGETRYLARQAYDKYKRKVAN